MNIHLIAIFDFTCINRQVLSAQQYKLLLRSDHILKSVRNVRVKLVEKPLLKIDGDFNLH